MTEVSVGNILANQRQFFQTGETRSTAFRHKALKDFKQTIIRNEQNILAALNKDLRNPVFETYASELSLIINEINTALKYLDKWVKPKKVKSTVPTFPSKNYYLHQPFGIALIIGPWNYPFQLTLAPLVGSIAAGNCSVIKPSEISEASSAVVAKIINEAFDKKYITTVEGDAQVASSLLDQEFDKIFYTGSPAVGQIVMEKAAKHLADVTLELGGKSPCIVDKDADLDLSAKRVLWGKYFNAGQNCISPDYLLVHKDIKQAFYASLEKWINTFFTTDHQSSPDLGRIINEKHYDRLLKFFNDGTLITGGQTDKTELFIGPAILEVTDLDTPVMQEEIFGPILPVVEYSELEEVEEIVARNPDPLALYIFSKDRAKVNRLTTNIPFGGGCINDTVIYIGNHNLPFGGKGSSGIGNYHGKYSFDAFSYKKSIMKRYFRFDPGLYYPPYKNKHTFLKKIFLK